MTMSETVEGWVLLKGIVILLVLAAAPYYVEYLVTIAARAWFREKLRSHHAMIAQTLHGR